MSDPARRRGRPFISTVVAAAGAIALAGACGGDEDTSERRPIGQRPEAGMQRELPPDHPEIGGQAPGGTRSGGGERSAAARRDLPEAVTVRLDSGNVAYRAGDYGEARRQFRAATEADSTAASAWFGVYMAERALGNEAAADSALRRAGSLGDAPGMHPPPGDTADDG
jgi:Flp pilus assembly protein TadD